MSSKTLKVPNISCGHCVSTIKRELEGVELVEANADTKQVTISWSEPASWDSIVRTLDEIGYPSQD